MTLVVGLAPIVAGCILGGTGDVATTEVGKGNDTEGVVTRVADGDTVEVVVTGEVIEVRLVAVNAPDQGECLADQALDHLVETLRDRTVRLEVVGEDQFGRTLAHLFEGDRHVNVELVETGHAFASTPDESDPHADAIVQAENEAYGSGAGIWGQDACGSHESLPTATIDSDRSTVDPAGPDDEFLDEEAVAILNDGNEAVDLSGWILRDESTRHRFTFPDGAALGPGDRVMVASSNQSWDPGDSPVWNNGGDMALLQLPDGTVVSRWRY